MKTLIAVATAVACLFSFDTKAQFLHNDACKFAEGQHNLGLPYQLIRDPVNPSTTFYTVSYDAVCYTRDAFADEIVFETFLTAETVGVGIRDIALSPSGAVAVIAPAPKLIGLERGTGEVDNYYEEWGLLNTRIWFSETVESGFYEIDVIAHAELGHIEDIWLNGKGDVLVAASTKKVATWRRVGRNWSVVNVTVLSDIGVEFFPSLHDIHSHPGCEEPYWGGGFYIKGHPDGDMVYIDAHRILAYTPVRRASHCELLHDDRRDADSMYGIVIEASVNDWQWRKPVFIDEEWCRGIPNRLARIRTQEDGWYIAVSPINPELTWAICPQNIVGQFARRDSDGWKKVDGGRYWDLYRFQLGIKYRASLLWSEFMASSVNDNILITSAKTLKFDGGRLLMNQVPHYGWSSQSEIDPAFIALDSDTGLMNFALHGSFFFGHKNIRMKRRIARGPHSEDKIDTLQVREGWGHLIDACTFQGRDMMVTVSRYRNKGAIYGSETRVDVWRTDGYQPVELLKSVDKVSQQRYSDPPMVYCGAEPYANDILVIGGTGQYEVYLRMNAQSFEVIEKNVFTGDVELIPSDKHKELGISGRYAGNFVCHDNGYIVWRGDWVQTHVPCKGGLSHPDYGLLIMSIDGIRWTNPEVYREALWDRSVKVSDEHDWNMIGFCGDPDDPNIILMGTGIAPKCMEFSLPTVTSSAYDHLEVGEALSNYPNPFLSATNLTFGLAQHGVVTLEIYDINGRRVSQLDIGVMSPGAHALQWDGGQMSSGVYMVRLVVDGVQVGDAHRLVRI